MARMRDTLRHQAKRWRAAHGVVATEVAFLVPVAMVGVMMLFELARIVLVIAVGSAALDKAVQGFRFDNLSAASPEQMSTRLKTSMVDSAYGYLSADNLTVNVLHFENLNQLGGFTASGTASNDTPNGEENTTTLPVWSVTVQIEKAFITPLPEVLTLGTTFRYQYKQVFGTELRNDND